MQMTMKTPCNKIFNKLERLKNIIEVFSSRYCQKENKISPMRDGKCKTEVMKLNTKTNGDKQQFQKIIP